MRTLSLLSSDQISTLSRLFDSWARAYTWPAIFPSESEPSYTHRAVRPAIQDWAKSLKRDSLFVRGDGGVPPRPVAAFGVFFYPDVELSEHDQRLLAVEVKFLRGTDPTGSIAKALGQALIYRVAGFQVSKALFFDCRSRSLINQEISDDVRGFPVDVLLLRNLRA
jgi:hypothetical protein